MMNLVRRGFQLRGNRSGAAYVLALTTLLVGLTLSIAMLQAAESYFLTENSRGRKQAAADLAEAGIDWACLQVSKNGKSLSDCTRTITLASGSVDVVATDYGQARMLVTSTGRVRGCTYKMRRVAKGVLIVDNTDAGFSCTSNWSTETMSVDKHGPDYRCHSTQATNEPATCTWTVKLPVGGSYEVYAWWEVGGNRSTTAPYIIYSNGGKVTVTANQQLNGGKFNLLGRWSFNSGDNTVQLSCGTTAGFIVCADAIEFKGPY